jgi:hypothetical protein
MIKTEPKLVNELEAIVNKGLEDSLIPYAKGNSIRIKNVVIRFNQYKGYLIYNTQTNSQIARTQFKSTALAIAKNYAEGKNVITRVLLIEQELLKHYNDAIFYKSAMRKSKNSDFIAIREIRLDIAIAKSKELRKKIDAFIF